MRGTRAKILRREALKIVLSNRSGHFKRTRRSRSQELASEVRHIYQQLKKGWTRNRPIESARAA